MSFHEIPLGTVIVVLENGFSFEGQGESHGYEWPNIALIVRCNAVYNLGGVYRANVRCADGRGWDNLLLDRVEEVVEDTDGVHSEAGTYCFSTVDDSIQVG